MQHLHVSYYRNGVRVVEDALREWTPIPFELTDSGRAYLAELDVEDEAGQVGANRTLASRKARSPGSRDNLKGIQDQRASG